MTALTQRTAQARTAQPIDERAFGAGDIILLARPLDTAELALLNRIAWVSIKELERHPAGYTHVIAEGDVSEMVYAELTLYAAALVPNEVRP